MAEDARARLERLRDELREDGAVRGYFGAAAASHLTRHAGGAAIGAAALRGAAVAWGEREQLRAGDRAALQRVAREAAAGAGAAAGRTVAAVAVKTAVKQVGGESMKRLAGSTPMTAVAFGAVEQGIDTVQLVRGRIDAREYGLRSVQNLGGTLGAIVGAAIGATVGSIVPLLGTVIGALVGGVLGGIIGGTGARLAASVLWWPARRAQPAEASVRVRA